MIIEYADKAWVLYAGNENILTETYANYYTYLTHLEYCKNKGYRVYDQFGTIGDLRKDNPRMGLHEFKKKIWWRLCRILRRVRLCYQSAYVFCFYKNGSIV